MRPGDEIDLAIDPAATERILVAFVRREVERTGRRAVVVGLSGGIDSAVSTYLAARALGPERVRCMMLPYATSSPDSLSDARAVVDDLGVPGEVVEVTAAVDALRATDPEMDRVRVGNLAARARMIVLFDRSALHDALVLGTSNKTELLLGYGTLFGDLASAVNPIGDLYKTQVRALAEHLGVPSSIRVKPPSADLWPDQTDEDDIGFAYEQIDRLLSLLVDARASRAAAVRAGFPEAFVDRITRMIVRSQFKRRMPVIAKISTRSIGWDFRYPRDWRS